MPCPVGAGISPPERVESTQSYAPVERSQQMSTLIRNKKKNSVIIPITGHEPIVLMPLGDANGGDVVMVEPDVAGTVRVKEALRRNLIEFVTEDDYEEVVARADAHLADSEAAVSEATEAVVERKQNRDLISSTCIGPGARETLTCGATVIQSQEVKRGDAPPLCSQHEHLAPNYYQTEVQVESDVDGPDQGPVTKKVWKRVEMTAPRRNLA